MTIKQRLDSWYNAFTGLGNALRDKTQMGYHVQSTRLSDAELEALFHDNDMAQKVVAKKIRDAMRRNFRISVEGDEGSAVPAAMHRYANALGYRKHIRDAATWGRVYGGACIFMGLDDGRDDKEPVDFEAIKTIKYLYVMDKRDLHPRTYYEDPEDKNYGQPETYQVQKQFVTPMPGGGGFSSDVTEIHESRLIRFGGAVTDHRRQQANSGWDDSALQAVYDILRIYGVTWQAIAILLQDSSQGVFKIQGLVDMIASGDKETLQARMETVDIGRSVARAIMLDAENESFERQYVPFTGIPEMLHQLAIRMSAAADMPVTVLMGQAPAGLNATGESDMRLWYDLVQEYQTETLSPRIEQLFRAIFAAQDFGFDEPEHWEIIFDNLWQPTSLEQAQLEKAVAEKDAIYMNAGVLLPEEVALNRFKARGFSMDTQIDQDARSEMLEAEMDLAKDQAGEPAEPVPTPPNTANAAKPPGEQNSTAFDGDE